MTAEIQEPTKVRDKSRLRLLIIARLIIITLFLGVAIFININESKFFVSPTVFKLFYTFIAITYLFSVIYILLLKTVEDLKINIYLQLSVDVLLITLLVYITGSLHSNYSLLYTLVIIYAVIFLGRSGGLIIASAAGICYGLLVDFEFYRIIPPLVITEYDYFLTAGEVFIRILVHLVSFYILAFLASFVVEQEKKTRVLLLEKESEFNQLDVLFRSIVESIDAGVMTINLQGIIKTFNRAAEEITGFMRSEVENRFLSEIFPSILASFSSETIHERFKSRIEIVIRGKNGRNIHAGYSISPLKDKQDKQIGNILIFQDLTEIKQMEENLEKSKRLALIGEMAAGLAHEMRNPLASITGSIELLRQGMKLESTDERLMQIILRGRDQLDNFVRDFLMLARPIPITRELVDLNEIIDEILESSKLTPDWTDKIMINKSLTQNVIAYANKEQMRQSIHNLVMNSIQAMKNGGILSISTKIIKNKNIKNVAEVKVMDTGCGIDDKDLKKVFEPFFTNKEKGTGLGLTIVSRIVDGYNGRMTIESGLNKGTTCTIWLPCDKK